MGASEWGYWQREGLRGWRLISKYKERISREGEGRPRICEKRTDRECGRTYLERSTVAFSLESSPDDVLQDAGSVVGPGAVESLKESALVLPMPAQGELGERADTTYTAEFGELARPLVQNSLVLEEDDGAVAGPEGAVDLALESLAGGC